MVFVREEMELTKSQIGSLVIASVAITVIARLFVGWLCDRIGPRAAYTWLLLLGSLPVMGVGLSSSFEALLIFRMMIGAIGASFVITQYHTSLMFAPNCVGTANATTAGWGNLGGGVTQLVMPMLFAGIVYMGFSDAMGWRLSMVVAGAVCGLTGIAYWFLTQDTPEGNFKELRESGKMPNKQAVKGTFLEACRDSRVWALFLVYGACFGIELTINNVAALYFVDYFDYFKNMDALEAAKLAGLCAGLFGLMNLFARTTGGYIGDLFGKKWGLSGRVRWLFIAIFFEGLFLMLFSQMNILMLALPTMLLFSLFVQMSEGATFAVVPFINKRALGSVSGIVGAGGNAGAVAAGFLFKAEAIAWPTALLILGVVVTLTSFLALLVRFSPEAETAVREEEASAKEGAPELAPSLN